MEDNDVNANSESEEQTHLSFMASHHFGYDDDDNEVSNDKPSYDELHDAYNDLNVKCLNLSKFSVNHNVVSITKKAKKKVVSF